MNRLKIALSSIFVILFVYFSYSQPKDNSPYSRFGLGDVADNEFTFVRSTGLGNSMYSYNQINIINQTSYGYLGTTIFDMGFYAKNSSFSSENSSDNVFSGNLDYISLAFPLINPLMIYWKKSKENLISV
ncbi:MAG: hypothetical protein R2771_03615 [Saprospiraceae bacterium]